MKEGKKKKRMIRVYVRTEEDKKKQIRVQFHHWLSRLTRHQ